MTATLSSFLALHSLAASRGEGLRPQLVELLERARLQMEGPCPAAPPENTAPQPAAEIAPGSLRWTDHLRF
jgi:hypothetical protein